ncbi:UrcA family protein [Erythrobacter ani]|uniref:UrcA family protein n=1 Tax=Erythrobacter ani TaxID=2827235 RepID=A0ABS6SJW0_9SPHN|nr:UrcA family protein [Erythrobacter ani]MBV7265303.1 UrcA family protein [Erythrobacter ani]
MRFTLPLLALAAVAAPLSAQTGEQIVDVRIAIADINLNTAEGRAALEQRIDAQLEKACTVASNSRYDYGRDVIDEKCFSDARADALAKVERVAANQARAGREVAAN